MPKIRKKLMIVLMVVSVSLVFNSFDVSAISESDIMKKWVFTQFYKCLNEYVNDNIATEEKNKNSLVVSSVFEDRKYIDLPSYDFGGLSRTGNVTCRALLTGDTAIGLRGVLDYAGIDKDVKWSDFDAAKSLLWDLGYGFTPAVDGYSFTINGRLTYKDYKGTSYDEEVKTMPISFVTSLGDDGKESITISDGEFADKNENQLKVTIKDNQLIIEPNFDYKTNVGYKYKCSSEDECPITVDISGVTTLEDLESIFKKNTYYLNVEYGGKYDEGMVAIPSEKNYVFEDSIIEKSQEGTFRYGRESLGRKITALEVIRDMFGMEAISFNSILTNLQLTPAETYMLYAYYLKKSIPDYVSNGIVCDSSEVNTDSFVSVRLKVDDGSIKTCYANYGNEDYKTINVKVQEVSDDGVPIIGEKNMEEIIAWLQSEENVNEDNLEGVGGIDDIGEQSDLDILKDTCGTGGAAGSLGWILCPLLNFMQGSTESLYEDFVEPALTVSPKLFSVSNSDSEDGNGAVYNAWEIFQRFSNIAFIILLLVVIFSQLTGVGIDNYGIKKILPKMIVGVILINVSYYVCLLAIDLSNVIGVGIQNIFEKMGDGIPFGKIEGQEFVYGSMGSVSFLAVIMTISTIWANPAILLSLLVSALGLLISIVFMFLILSARQAMLVVLTVVAPVAIACYILPNTKTVFSKWLKAGWMLLLVFPICGLMVGGGNFVSKLLLGVADGNIYSALIAMVAGIAPIFFIPSVLKWSLTAVGKVGGVLSGLGDTARRGVTGALNKDPRLQNLKKAGEDRANRIRLRRQAGGYVDAEGKFHASGLRSRIAGTGVGRFLGMDARMGEARDNYIKSQIARNEAKAHLDASFANQALQEAQTQLKDAKMKAEVDVELGAKPALDRENYRIRTENAINEAKADNAVRVVGVSEALARTRKESAIEAQEIKNYTDQNANLTRNGMKGELLNAAEAYSADKSYNNMVRLKAAIMSSEGRGMNDEMYECLGKIRMTFTEDPNSKDAKDARILDEFARSKDIILSQYGKQMSKPDHTGTTLSIDEFTAGKNSSVNLKNALDAIGQNSLVGANDDTFKYIAEHGGAAVASSDKLLNAAANTANDKELKQIERILTSFTNPSQDISFSGNTLGKLSPSILSALRNKIIQAPLGSNLRESFIRASNDIAKDPNMRSNLNPKLLEEINLIRNSDTYTLPPI